MNIKNNLKEKLKSGKMCLGSWVTIGNPDVVEILKNFEFDWLLFDMEHSYMSIETVKTMLQALGDGPATPLARIGANDQLLTKRVLDSGAQGILVPLVNSGAEARSAVRYAMYPPRGVRGAGPGRAATFGMKASEYLRRANDEVVMGVQIETVEALSNAEEIISTDGVDIGFVGPSDLTISLGLIDDRGNPRVADAMRDVVRICKKYDRVPGTMALTIEEARKWSELGFRFISLASDARHLISGARSFLESAKKLLPQ